MAISTRKWIKLIGPYPYNPTLIFLFFSSIFFSRFAPFVSLYPAGSERFKAAALVILASIIPGFILSMGAMLLNRFRFWSRESTFLYILEVAFFQLLNLFILRRIAYFLTGHIDKLGTTLLPLTPNVFIGTLVIALISLALMHQAERQVVERLTKANDLVLKLEAERAELIQADEKLRRQTSQFLHDRVQSDLMVVSMKLKSISEHSSAEVNEVIDRAIERLEKTRARDLRNLIQILTPNLEAGSLRSALDALLEQYRGNMEVSLQISESSEELDSEILLGIFRIVEQSILNSLVHGSPHRVQISVSTNSAGMTDIVISDDGTGSAVEEIVPGVGTAIIDSWVGILNGSKEIDSAPGHGYRLQVTFPK